MPAANQDVRIWNVQDRRKSEQYKSRPWVVRWRVGERRFQRAFRTRHEADHLRSEFLVAQRNGEAFDLSTGEPQSWRATDDVAVHDWVRRWLGEQWDEWQPRTRKGAVEEMSRFIPLVVRPAAPDPPGDLRVYLKAALWPTAERDDRLERWMDRWCYSLQQLDRSVLAEADRRLAVGVKGDILSPVTALRYRKAARSCIRRAADLDLIDRDPWPPPAHGARNRKVRRKALSRAFDVKRLPDADTMQQALNAMKNHQPASRMYYVMTSVMAYGGLRPSEVLMLRPRSLVLPKHGWGAIEVTEADIDFDVSGDPKTGPRTVPIPADLVALLASWIQDHEFCLDELIFRSSSGRRPSGSNWRRAWHLALRKIGHEPLRPYDCRHFAATMWLHAGVPLGEVAQRLGHSVETLVSTYVGALAGDETRANELIDGYRSRTLKQPLVARRTGGSAEPKGLLVPIRLDGVRTSLRQRPFAFHLNGDRVADAGLHWNPNDVVAAITAIASRCVVLKSHFRHFVPIRGVACAFRTPAPPLRCHSVDAGIGCLLSGVSDADSCHRCYERDGYTGNTLAG